MLSINPNLKEKCHNNFVSSLIYLSFCCAFISKMWYNIPLVFYPFPWIFSKEVPNTDYIRQGYPKHINLMLPEVQLMVSLLYPLTNYPPFFNLRDFPKKTLNLLTPSLKKFSQLSLHFHSCLLFLCLNLIFSTSNFDAQCCNFFILGIFLFVIL